MRDVFYNKQQPLANEFVDYFYELSETSHNILFINRLAHISGMRKELFLKSDLPKINRPVLVIWGLKDPLMPFRTVKEQIDLIPNVKLEKLENVGHMPPVEAAAKFNRLAISFLRAK
jgi:pimeloyl-ACP methyl ester carboxylesterase